MAVRWTRRTAGLGLALAALAAGATGAHADGVTYGHDDGRTGWYPDQTNLGPALVGGGTFGQQFSAPVDGQVYAQPLQSGGTVLVATETNQVYGLDPDSGAQQWHRSLGTPFDPTSGPRISCSDLTPSVGVTGTPVIDPSTSTAYMAAKRMSGSTPVYELHAVDMASGAERAGFPVRYQGAADNAPSIAFDPVPELQRPALLLLGGTVYAAFGGHCDQDTWRGWIIGVRGYGQSAAGTITSRWLAAANGALGAGIWQAGSGLMSDGPGRIFAVTGNADGAGGTPTVPAPATSPPSGLGESAVRLEPGATGTLSARNFFTPHDAADLDSWDADFASGGPVALPDSFGDATHPHLMTVVGKKGIVYLLDRDALGGFKQGPSGGDLVVDASGQRGGVWSKPSVWPGDGGWVLVPTASGGDSASGSAGTLDAYRRTTVSGHPALVYAGGAAGAFGFGSSAPVITSDATTSSSAVAWIIYSPNGSGTGAELRAYRPVPDGTSRQMQLLGSWPVGTATKFTPPGVGYNRLFVGTRDGHVLGFGAPSSPPLTSSSTTFPTTTVGSTSTRTVTFTATRTTTVQSLTLSSADGAFTTGTPSPALPATLSAGQTVSVPVTFAPSSAGLKGATLTAATAADGPVSSALSGTGQATGPMLVADARVLDFGGVTLGQEQRASVTFSNQGGSPLHISAVQAPGAPFTVEGLAPGTLAPGASVTAVVHFAPTTSGDFADELHLVSDSGTPPGTAAADVGRVGLTGAGATPGLLTIDPPQLAFGTLAPGTDAVASVTLRNTGGSAVRIFKSKPPAGGVFTALDAVDEGTTLQAGDVRTVRVRFAPPAAGTYADTWELNADDGQGVRALTLSGRAEAPASPPDGSVSGAGQSAGAASPPSIAVAPLAPLAGPAVPRILGLRLSAWRFRTSARLKIRGAGADRARIVLQRRGATRWVQRAGHHDVRLPGGSATATISARGLRAGRWRAVVRPLPSGTARTVEFFVAR